MPHKLVTYIGYRIGCDVVRNGEVQSVYILTACRILDGVVINAADGVMVVPIGCLKD